MTCRSVRLGALAIGAMVHLSATAVHAQVMIAPPVLVLSERSPFATLVVINQSADTQEVTIDFRFGHPMGDSLGTVLMVYGDSLPAASRSVDATVRAFPRQFTLAPQQQQLVRITASPSGTAAGTYWTRVVTSSSVAGGAPDTTSQAVSARLLFRLEQVTTLLFRRGEVSTALRIDGDPVSVAGEGAGVLVSLRVGGNSPFLGGARLRLLDMQGTTVGESIEYFAVYVDMPKRFAFPEGVSPGRYICELRISAERPDLARELILPAEPLQRRFECTVP
jgi:hypothetical protein